MNTYNFMTSCCECRTICEHEFMDQICRVYDAAAVSAHCREAVSSAALTPLVEFTFVSKRSRLYWDRVSRKLHSLR